METRRAVEALAAMAQETRLEALRLLVQAGPEGLPAGEIARLSYESMFSTDEKGRPQSLRVRTYRSDPEGGMLGPLNATHFAVGDVGGLTNRLLSSSSGRGAGPSKLIPVG